MHAECRVKPGLTPLDVYLWGFLKDQVYRNSLKNLEDMKTAITQLAQTITIDKCGRVISEMERRATFCMLRKVGHFDQAL